MSTIQMTTFSVIAAAAGAVGVLYYLRKSRNELVGSRGGPYFIGVDIGGTAVKLGLVDADANIVAQATEQVAVDERSAQAVVDLTAQLFRKVLERSGVPKQQIAAAGVVVPGLLDVQTGVVKSLSNYDWKNAPIGQMLHKALNVRIAMENDANGALLGEVWAGGAKGCRHAVMITLGTGVGGAAISDGHLIRGAHGFATEIGHTIIVPGGRLSEGTGVRGVLEEYASARAVGARGSEALGLPVKGEGSLSCKDVFERASTGDEACSKVLDDTYMYIALACINVVRCFDCQVVLLGGGMTLASTALLSNVRRHFEKLHWNIDPPHCEIRFAALGTDAGIIGAASCALLLNKSMKIE